MTNPVSKADILHAVSDLPEDATLDDAFERLFVLHKIEQGLEDARAGRTMSQSEVETYFRDRRHTRSKS